MAAKDILKSLVMLMPRNVSDRIFAWRHRRLWLDKQGQGRFHEAYFADYMSRLPIAEAISAIIESDKIQSPRILEFGCSGGNNLKLLREKIHVPLSYCGLDIQEDAIHFARRQFPSDTFYSIRGNEFEELKPRLGQFDIFLVSGVLSYMHQQETEKLLTFARTKARYLVVCDITERFDLPTGANDGLFLHPYELLCLSAGFRVTVPPPPDPPDRFAVFTALSDATTAHPSN